MRVCRQSKPAIWLGVLLCLVSLPVQSTHAQAETTLLIDPAAASLAPGEGARLALSVHEANDVYGVEIHIQFEPAVVQVVDQDPDKPGIQVAGGDFFDLTEGFLITNQVDNGTGEITYAFTQLLPATPKQGDGELLSFEIQAVAVGESQVVLELAILANADGESLPFSARGGQVTVVGEGAETPTARPASSTPPGTPGQASPTATSPPILPTGTPLAVTPSATSAESLPTSGLTPTRRPTAIQDAADTAMAMAIAAITDQPSPSPTRTRLAVPTARPAGTTEAEQSPPVFGTWWPWALGLLVLLIVGSGIIYFLRSRRGQKAE